MSKTQEFLSQFENKELSKVNIHIALSIGELRPRI